MVDDSEHADPATDPTVQQTPGEAPTVARGTDPSAGTLTPPTVAQPGGRRREAPIQPELGSNRYRLGELLGQGGMGEVVLAYDEQIGREVAVKRIRFEEPTAELRSRFVREARVQGRLEHPAVVPVHDLSIDADGRPFFVMKRVSGRVMSDLLREPAGEGGAPNDESRRRLLRAFAEVCLAVEFAHAKGIIHRDLKPSNIMLGDFGEVYVLDWGIARAVAEADEIAPRATNQPDLELDTGQTRDGTVLGTPAYMAPEQHAGERVGPAADIYALGCILFEIVAGEPLHRGRRSVAELATGVDARPSRLRAESPPELDAICDRATRTQPAERMMSARALGDAVQAYLDGDRDLAVRRDLARVHIDEAQAAIARGDDEDNRRIAMRAAGRALALDPTATSAADLVTHLVLRPPLHPPAEVEEALARVDTQTAKEQGRLAALSLIGYLAFVPLLLWSGVRDMTFILAFTGLVLASMIQVSALTTRDRITPGGIYLNACINAVLIGLICRMVGPFIIAPTLAATTLMAYAAHPRFGKIGIMAAIMAAAVAVPWGLELAGVVSPTYAFVDGSIVLHSSVVVFRSAPVQIAFAMLLVALLGIVALLSRMMAERQRDASRRVELQAWHLRQLVPAPP